MLQIDKIKKEFVKNFGEYNLFELPKIVNEVRGSVKTLGDEIMFYNGKFLPLDTISDWWLSKLAKSISQHNELLIKKIEKFMPELNKLEREDIITLIKNSK